MRSFNKISMHVLLSIVVFSASMAYAVNYVVDTENKVVMKLNYTPSMDELLYQNFVVIHSDLDIPLQDAEYRGNKIVKRVKTKEDKDKDKADKERQVEFQLIRKRADQEAYIKMKMENHVFKHVTDVDMGVNGTIIP